MLGGIGEAQPSQSKLACDIDKGEFMNTLFAVSSNGTQIAYDRIGKGPAVLLVHGGGGSRREWYDAGYVSRLQHAFTVIAFDLRGHGESGMPINPSDYSIDKMIQDILAVADACSIERFTVWGMSYGGNVSRYLAAQSDRVSRLILMGTKLGLGVSGQLRQDAVDFCAQWPKILQAQRAGILDMASLSKNDQDMLSQFNIPVMLGWVRAMLDWPAVEPADFRCPTLWLIGSEDVPAVDSLDQYRPSLEGSNVKVHVFDGLNHEQLFDEIDTVFPFMLDFTLL